MLSNVGHTIQKMLNNTPVAITVNDQTSTVVTNGGGVFETGFIGGKVQNTFRPIDANILGCVVDAASVEGGSYLLTDSGSVYFYDNNVGGCGAVVREVYSPTACNGDKAKRIKSGSNHVLILTHCGKVWGAGNNEEYQLVPQGQCKYDTAVELYITDTNLHDNDCCNSFTGNYTELTKPVIPGSNKNCNQISCVKDELCDVVVGHLTIQNVVVSPNEDAGTLSIPVYGDLSYVGFLCVDKRGCATGSLTYSITKVYIKCGCFIGKITTRDLRGCHIREVNISSTKEVVIFESTDDCPTPKSNPCGKDLIGPITGSVQVNGKCGDCVVVNVDTPNLDLPVPAFDADCNTIVLQLGNCKTSLTVLCDGSFESVDSDSTEVRLDFDVPLDCNVAPAPKHEVLLPQPCWVEIFAGFNVSVLVDSCNRLYALGSLHNVRSNKELIKKSCLEELLNKTHASISFPADQLNCACRPALNETCNRCNPKCKDKFRTDLSKFGIHLSFPNGEDGRCENKSMNVCDFLHDLKKCNELDCCDNTCEPCDGYIYLNVSGECGCPCGAPSSGAIGSVTLLNKKSICKLVSQGHPDEVVYDTTLNTIVEFDLHKYCIDANDIPLDRIVKLNFCNDGPNVNLYVDLDKPGGIKFTSDGKRCNVDFTVTASTQNHQFLLNFGSILDPVQLTNLKYALSLDAYYPCPQFKNPFDTKITNTYLKGGDHVRFVIGNPKNIRQAVTADVPTVFRLNRRILDVAVGNNNLTVLVGGLACPNEIFAIGQNCYGELGLNNYESIVCWKQINRCIFDCQVVRVFAGQRVTFYATQSNHIYGAGQWKNLVHCDTPVVIRSICQSWKIRELAVSNSHIVMLGSDGGIFGVGDNNLGELGLGHVECVKKPSPLAFFYKLNHGLAERICHPIEARVKNVWTYKPRHDEEYSDDEETERFYHKSPRSCGPCGGNPPKKYYPNNRVYVKGARW